MEDNNNKGKSLARCSIIVHSDPSEADNVPQMLCPLCGSSVHLYFIHYDEKFLMCKNFDCPYPIGFDDYHVFKVDCSDEMLKNKGTSVSGSSVSLSDWSDIDMTNMTEGPLSPLSCVSAQSSQSLVEKPQDMEKIQKVKLIKEKEHRIQRDVKRIKELNQQLYERDEEMDSINNESWIKHIAEMQERSGIQLLKEHELKKVKRKIPKINMGELKIDVETGTHSISLKLDSDEVTKANERK